jgi:hypothetical protein
MARSENGRWYVLVWVRSHPVNWLTGILRSCCPGTGAEGTGSGARWASPGWTPGKGTTLATRSRFVSGRSATLAALTGPSVQGERQNFQGQEGSICSTGMLDHSTPAASKHSSARPAGFEPATRCLEGRACIARC